MRLSRRSTVSWLLSEGGCGHDTFHLPITFKRITHGGVHGVLFQFTKVTTASPHTTQEYQPCHGFLWVFAKPPASHFRPRRSGPNYYLPSPRRALKSAAAPGHRQPQPLYPASFPSEPPSSSPKKHLLSQFHLTIDRRRSQQHTLKINRITVYPFTFSVTGKPLLYLFFQIPIDFTSMKC